MKKKGEINYNGKQHWTVYISESKSNPKKAEMFVDAGIFTVWGIYCIIKLCDYIEFLRKAHDKAHDKEIDAIMEILKDHKESIEKIIKGGGESWT